MTFKGCYSRCVERVKTEGVTMIECINMKGRRVKEIEKFFPLI